MSTEIVINATSVGPLDGRHLIIVPKGMLLNDELRRYADAISMHFLDAHRVVHPDGCKCPAAAIVPMLIEGVIVADNTGDLRVEVAE